MSNGASLALRFVTWLTSKLPPPRIIFDREGGSPYLSRWYLVGSGIDYDGDGKRVRGLFPWSPITVNVHRFHRSDDDGALHSHPWKWALAIVLVNGYCEERRIGDRVVKRDVRPFSLNFLRAEDFHRVDLYDGSPAWTIFIQGPKSGTWFFWDRETRRRIGWRAFVATKRGQAPEEQWRDDKREA